MFEEPATSQAFLDASWVEGGLQFVGIVSTLLFLVWMGTRTSRQFKVDCEISEALQLVEEQTKRIY